MNDSVVASPKAGIMQPYFLPYIGYFQIIAAVDLFIVYDNIKYTKKGWINRNRYLQNGRATVFTVPLAADSDFLDVRDRKIAEDFDRRKFLARIAHAYDKAPFVEPAFALLEKVVSNPERNLFDFLYASILEVCRYLEISTPIVPSSKIRIDHSLPGQDKVIALCRQVGAATYINAIGGLELYDKKTFAANGIDLLFLKPAAVEYAQFGASFVPSLSILDVMMFNAPDTIRGYLASGYELVTGPV